MTKAKKTPKEPKPPIQLYEKDRAAAAEIQEESAESKFTPPALCFIRCKGIEIIDGESGEIRLIHAEGHRKLRRVRKSSLHQTTRCEACQKLASRKSQHIGAGKIKKKLKTAIKDGKDAAKNLKEFGDALLEEGMQEDYDLMQEYVRDGKNAQEALAKIESKED